MLLVVGVVGQGFWSEMWRSFLVCNLFFLFWRGGRRRGDRRWEGQYDQRHDTEMSLLIPE